MKTTDSMIGGSAAAPMPRRPFADYFVRFIQAYEAAGVADRLHHAAERAALPAGRLPGHAHGAGARSGTGVRDNLGPALADGRHSDTDVLAYDHNWDVTELSRDGLRRSGRRRRPWPARRGTATAARSARRARCTTRIPNEEAHHTECSGGEWQGDAARGLRRDDGARHQCAPQLGAQRRALEHGARRRATGRPMTAASPAAAW